MGPRVLPSLIALVGGAASKRRLRRHSASVADLVGARRPRSRPVSICRNLARAVGLGLALGALAGCGSDGTTSARSATGAEDVTVGFVTANQSDPFYATMQRGAEDAANRLGVELIWQGPNEFSPQAQLPFLNAVLAKRPDAFIFSPTDGKALVSVVQRAKTAGMPVLTADTQLDDSSPLATKIIADNRGAGELAGRVLAKAMDENGDVYVMNGVPTVSNDKLRLEGFLAELERHPGMRYLGNQYSGDKPTRAAAQIQAVLRGKPSIGGVFCVDTPTCVGTVRGLDAAGRLDDVKVVAFDAAPEVVKAVGERRILATIAQQPAKEAAIAVEKAVALARDPSARLDKEIVVPAVAISQDNFAQTRTYAYGDGQ